MIQDGHAPFSDRPRRSRRLKSFVPATLGGTHPGRVHILNISCSGALCHGQRPPASGARVTLDSAGLSVAALVIWCDGPRFGLRFQQPMSEEQVERMLGAAD